MLAYPHAYTTLEAHGRAALLYGHALETFSGEIDKVDSSIDAIREGRFLTALTREETRQDRSWVVRLRQLPDSPETFYLTELMASHDFQTALQNYLDLEDLRARLASWRTSFDAFEDMIRLRAANYEPHPAGHRHRLPGARLADARAGSSSASASPRGCTRC